jgi:CO dehydrogenase/acetyl-CoA synthase gamma subunit (corrinoid Fe-S protein)
MANTKLSKQQKSLLKGMLIEASEAGIQVLVLDNRTVMAFRDVGNTVQFALSVKSPDEKKFRPSVGKMKALQRLMWNNEFVSMARDDFEIMCEMVYDAYPL